MTAGTIFDRTRTPLTVWFTVCWQFAIGKEGVSAQSVQRTLEIGETFIGGEEPGLRGGRARGKKVLTCIAVEVHEPKGLGRCRMAPIRDASAASLRAFVTDHVEPD